MALATISLGDRAYLLQIHCLGDGTSIIGVRVCDMQSQQTWYGNTATEISSFFSAEQIMPGSKLVMDSLAASKFGYNFVNADGEGHAHARSDDILVFSINVESISPEHPEFIFSLPQTTPPVEAVQAERHSVSTATKRVHSEMTVGDPAPVISSAEYHKLRKFIGLLFEKYIDMKKQHSEKIEILERDHVQLKLEASLMRQELNALKTQQATKPAKRRNTTTKKSVNTEVDHPVANAILPSNQAAESGACPLSQPAPTGPSMVPYLRFEWEVEIIIAAISRYGCHFTMRSSPSNGGLIMVEWNGNKVGVTSKAFSNALSPLLQSGVRMMCELKPPEGNDSAVSKLPALVEMYGPPEMEDDAIKAVRGLGVVAYQLEKK